MLIVMAELHDSLVIRHQPAGWRGAFVAERDGKRLAEGSMDTVQQDPKVIEVYIGH